METTTLPGYNLAIDANVFNRARTLSQLHAVMGIKYTDKFQGNFSETYRATHAACHMTRNASPLGIWAQYPIEIGAGPDERIADKQLAMDNCIVRVSPFVSQFFPAESLPGAIAHELGHIEMQHSRKLDNLEQEFRITEIYPDWDGDWNHLPSEKLSDHLRKIFHAQEFAADQFAVDHGFLDSLVVLFGLEERLDLTDVTHPSVNERLERLRA